MGWLLAVWTVAEAAPYGGLRVVLEPDPEARFVAAAMVIDGGQAADDPGKEGTAHLLEHLWFRAHVPGDSPNGPGETVGGLLRARSADYAAYTELDHTVFLTVLPAGSADLLLDLEIARLADPLRGVRPAEVELERETVVSELALRGSERSAVVPELLHEMLFPPDHPYRRWTTQTRVGVRAVTEADLRGHVERWYQPAHATLVLSGALPPEPVVTARLTAAFPADAEPAPPPVASPLPPLPQAEGEVRAFAEVPTPTAVLGWSLPGTTVGFDPTLALAGQIVDNVLTGVLLDQGVIDEPWGVQCGLLPRRVDSLYSCAISLGAGDWPDEVAWAALAQLDEILFSQVRAVVDDYVSDARGHVLLDVDLAEEAARGGALGALQDHAVALHVSGGRDTYDAQRVAIIRTRPDAVLSLARRLLTRRRAVLLTLVPRLDELDPPDDRVVATVASTGRSDGATSWSSPPAPPLSTDGWTEATLPNGLRVLVVPHASPLVHAELVLRGGRARAPSLRAESLAEALPRVPEPRDEDEDEDEDEEGADRAPLWRGGTASEALGRSFSASARGDDLTPALEGLAHRVIDLAWTRKGLAAERAERRSRAPPDPAAFAWWWRLAAVLPGSPVVRLAETRRIRGEDLRLARTWFRAQFQPTNAVLVVTGDVKADEVLAVAEAHWGRWAPARGATPVQEPGPAEAASARAFRGFEVAGAAWADVGMTCRLSAADQPTWATGRVAESLVEAAAWRVLREEGGWSYAPHAFVERFAAGDAVLHLGAPVAALHTGPAVRALGDIVAGLAGAGPTGEGLTEEGLTEEGLAVARGQVLTALALQRRGVEGELARLREALLHGWDWRDLPALEAATTGVALTDVQALLAPCAGTAHVSVVGTAEAVAAGKAAFEGGDAPSGSAPSAAPAPG